MGHAEAKLFGDVKDNSRPFSKMTEDDLERGEEDDVPLNAIHPRSNRSIRVREDQRRV